MPSGCRLAAHDLVGLVLRSRQDPLGPGLGAGAELINLALGVENHRDHHTVGSDSG